MQLNSPPWLLEQPVVILDPLTYQEKLYKILEKYPNHLYNYTDGSKDNNGTGCGAVFNSKIKECLSKEASIFTAEISAINLVLKIISTSNSKKFIIHSDSISVLQLIKNRKLDNLLIVKLLNKLNFISHCKNVIFCWIPKLIHLLKPHSTWYQTKTRKYNTLT